MFWGYGGFGVLIALCHILKCKETIRKEVGFKKKYTTAVHVYYAINNEPQSFQ